MKVIIGIDIGGSTTKIIGMRDGEIIGTLKIRADDPVSSLFGAFGKFTYENNIALNDVEKVVLTGVGASYITEPIYGVPTKKVEEFYANGLGGLYLSGLDSAIVVSMGTGTALVKANGDGDIVHIGGTAVGGGTILGLARQMLNISHIDNVLELAKTGNLENIDLNVGHITKNVLPGLPPETTAANFGKVNELATPNDVALGIINLVLQSIFTSAIFAIYNMDIENIVFIGNISTFPQCKDLVPKMKPLTEANLVIPKMSLFATAIGAALAESK